MSGLETQKYEGDRVENRKTPRKVKMRDAWGVKNVVEIIKIRTF